ncbi:DsrE family protein [Snodgrassella sp. CFCC 13594]|uniref:DsrE family protein n=1 Tax=Snodgrassella sp. CFCC 13594 TaxID=1775559 RepID=UPI00082AADC4|nr:DsrE family protein [Snodgrassella sp. CFCC 13594]
MKKWLWAGFAGILLSQTWAAVAAPSAQGQPSLKVLVHVDELSVWPHALANINNLAVGSHDAAQIEVVVNGAAAAVTDKTVRDNQPVIARMQELAQAHQVDFVVCANSLSAQQIGTAKLPSFFREVPVGVLELAQKQQQGYSYIKP